MGRFLPEGEGQEAFLERTRLGFEQMMEHLMDPSVPGSSICRTRRYDHGGFVSVFSNGRRLL